VTPFLFGRASRAAGHLRRKLVKKSWLAIVVCAIVLPAAAQGTADSAAAPVVEKGKMLVASNGARLGVVYRVAADGAAQIIIDGKMVSIPANTLANVNGKLTTSLSKSEVLALH
jgi:hypothetical protein